MSLCNLMSTQSNRPVGALAKCLATIAFASTLSLTVSLTAFAEDHGRHAEAIKHHQRVAYAARTLAEHGKRITETAKRISETSNTAAVIASIQAKAEKLFAEAKANPAAAKAKGEALAAAIEADPAGAKAKALDFTHKEIAELNAMGIDPKAFYENLTPEQKNQIRRTISHKYDVVIQNHQSAAQLLKTIMQSNEYVANLMQAADEAWNNFNQ